MNVVMSTAAPTARELRQSEELVKVSYAAPPLPPFPTTLCHLRLQRTPTCILAVLYLVVAVSHNSEQRRLRAT